MHLHARRMNVIAFLKGLTYLFESSAGVRGISLTFCAGTDEQEIYCDRDVLEKIVSNLLSNALKFTPSGGRVEVGVKRETDSLLLTVSDTGIGIAGEHLTHVFDRFYQVDSSMTREHEGSGIGLALVKELVELHHGTVSAASTPGVGTTFTIRLPLGKGHLKPEELDERTVEEVQEKGATEQGDLELTGVS